MSSDCKTKSPGSADPASFPCPRGYSTLKELKTQLPVTNGRPLASQGGKKEERGREKEENKNREILTDAVSQPLRDPGQTQTWKR